MKNFSPRTILGLIFISSLMMLWLNWQTLQYEKAQKNQPVAQLAQNAGTTAGTTPQSSNGLTQAASGLGLDGDVVTLENDVVQIDINTQGGTVQLAALKKFPHSVDPSAVVALQSVKGKDPSVIFPSPVYISRSGIVNAETQLNHLQKFTADQTLAQLSEGANEVKLSLTATSNGIEYQKIFTLTKGSYEVQVDHVINNQSEAEFAPRVYLDIVRDATQVGHSKFYSTYTGPAMFSKDNKFTKVDFGKIDKNNVDIKEKASDGWVGMIQHYFVSAWVVKDPFEREFYTRIEQTSPFKAYTIGEIVSLPALKSGTSETLKSILYVGPQDQDKLAALSEGLDRSVDYGIWTIIAKPLHIILTWIHAVVPNWGWSIVILTILVKLCFFPLTAASYKSMAKTRDIMPKVKALQELYKDDRVKAQQEVMALYRAEKVNPAGGCLPLLVTFPVFLALYSVLQGAVEMRGAPWVGWIHDLSLPDPFYILPLLMIGTMYLQTLMSPPPPDPMQAKMMKIMPLMFGVTFFFFPAGLVLYWVVSNIFGIAQQRVINQKYATVQKSHH